MNADPEVSLIVTQKYPWSGQLYFSFNSTFWIFSLHICFILNYQFNEDLTEKRKYGYKYQSQKCFFLKFLKYVISQSQWWMQNIYWCFWNIIQRIKFKNKSRDFKHKKYENWTELSKYIDSLKSRGTTAIIKWSIFKRVSCKTLSNYCKLV